MPKVPTLDWEDQYKRDYRGADELDSSTLGSRVNLQASGAGTIYGDTTVLTSSVDFADGSTRTLAIANESNPYPWLDSDGFIVTAGLYRLSAIISPSVSATDNQKLIQVRRPGDLHYGFQYADVALQPQSVDWVFSVAGDNLTQLRAAATFSGDVDDTAAVSVQVSIMALILG